MIISERRNIRKADTIMVLVDGHIAEIGTHEQLAGSTRVF
jgi:ABC-type multidrug transport system fused ATPase/permease subunit